MTTQHTPGPWYASKGEQPQIASENDKSGRTLALVYDVRDEAKANAALIAAAPGLLAACEWAESLCESFGSTLSKNQVLEWQKLRAAIAKAGGAK